MRHRYGSSSRPVRMKTTREITFRSSLSSFRERQGVLTRVSKTIKDFRNERNTPRGCPLVGFIRGRPNCFTAGPNSKTPDGAGVLSELRQILRPGVRKEESLCKGLNLLLRNPRTKSAVNQVGLCRIRSPTRSTSSKLGTWSKQGIKVLNGLRDPRNRKKAFLNLPM